MAAMTIFSTAKMDTGVKATVIITSSTFSPAQPRARRLSFANINATVAYNKFSTFLDRNRLNERYCHFGVLLRNQLGAVLTASSEYKRVQSNR